VDECKPLESGEMSVFDSELKKSSAPSVPRPAPTREPAVVKQAPKPRVYNAEQQARLAHNAAVAANKPTDELRRAMFLQKHLAALGPFITNSVLTSITAAAGSTAAAALPPVPPPVEDQPEGIGGTMREYQLLGVSWLVGRGLHSSTSAQPEPFLTQNTP